MFLDGVIYDTDCRRIIAVNRGGRLWVPELFERQAYDASFFDIVKKGSEFGFCGGGGDKFEDGANNMKETVEFYPFDLRRDGMLRWPG